MNVKKCENVCRDKILHNSADICGQNVKFTAKLYYTSWSLGCWDMIGMEVHQLGSVPTSCHPKPWPSTPRDLFDISIVLYQKETQEVQITGLLRIVSLSPSTPRRWRNMIKTLFLPVFACCPCHYVSNLYFFWTQAPFELVCADSWSSSITNLNIVQ